MGRRQKRIAFIPVRGGSKSIPKKNIKEIAGKPLVYWVIDAALGSEVFNEIFISTDAPEIEEIVKQHPNAKKLSLIQRSPATATDSASTESAILEFAENNSFELITLIQATSPLLKARDLKEGMEKFLKNKNAVSLLSVCRQERFIWEENERGLVNPSNYELFNRPRRQEFEGFLVENGAFYITRKDHLMKSRNRLSGEIICYEMSPETYYELDEPADWSIIEELLHRKQKASLIEKIKDIQLFLTDVDGVLTDAGMYYSEKGDELKKFNTRDGKGMELLRKQGLKVGIITSEDTQIVADRAHKLKVNILHQGIKNKGKLLNDILDELDLQEHQVAYIGDDINDLSIMNRVGFTAAPANAIEEVKSSVDFICTKKGGEGCVREVSELILKFHRSD